MTYTASKLTPMATHHGSLLHLISILISEVWPEVIIQMVLQMMNSKIHAQMERIMTVICYLIQMTQTVTIRLEQGNYLSTGTLHTDLVMV